MTVWYIGSSVAITALCGLFLWLLGRAGKQSEFMDMKRKAENEAIQVQIAKEAQDVEANIDRMSDDAVRRKLSELWTRKH